MSESRADDDLRLLVDLIRETASPAELATWPDDRLASLINVSRQHGVEPWLAAVAPSRSAGAPVTPAGADLEQQHARFAARVARDRRELRQFAAIAARVGTRWAVLKGVGLAEDVYPRPDMRFGVDIDVLVEPAAFEAVVIALTSAGWTLNDQNWPLIAQARLAELSLSSPGGALFDLHWHVTNSYAERRAIELPTEDLLARTRTLESGLPVLGKEDQLIHVAVHAAASGANRLHWLLDAHLAAAAITDWPSLANRARSAGVGLRVAMVLMRSERCFGQRRPTSTLRALGAGPGFRAVGQGIDRISPLAPDPLRGSFARSFARSVRRTSPSTAAEFARHGAGFIRNGAHRFDQHQAVRDPADPRSALHVVPDEAARARYFATIEPETPNRPATTSASSVAE